MPNSREAGAGAHLVGDGLEPYEAAHARHERGVVEGLRQEIVGAGVEPLEAVARLVERGHHHDRQMRRERRVLEPPADLEAVHVRHHHVEEDDIGKALLADRERVRAVHGGGDVEILGRQLGFQ
jgi:hypothetical protein